MGKRWQSYEEILLQGDWHIHSDYVDGTCSIPEILLTAEKNHLKIVAIIEHIQLNPTYSFIELLNMVKSIAPSYNVIVLVGCEAKILNNQGNLNIPQQLINIAELITFVFHSFPKISKKEYLTLINKVINKNEVDIWGHPTLYLKKRKLSLTIKEMDSLINQFNNKNILFEFNSRYKLPSETFINLIIKRGHYVYGSDAHSCSEILSLNKIQMLFPHKH